MGVPWRAVQCCLLLWLASAQVQCVEAGSRDRRSAECRQCPAGTYASSPCYQGSNTVCTECPPRTFTPALNLLPSCLPCSVCDTGRPQVKACTPTSDTTCQGHDLMQGDDPTTLNDDVFSPSPASDVKKVVPERSAGHEDEKAEPDNAVEVSIQNEGEAKTPDNAEEVSIQKEGEEARTPDNAEEVSIQKEGEKTGIPDKPETAEEASAQSRIANDTESDVQTEPATPAQGSDADDSLTPPDSHPGTDAADTKHEEEPESQPEAEIDAETNIVAELESEAKAENDSETELKAKNNQPETAEAKTAALPEKHEKEEQDESVTQSSPQADDLEDEEEEAGDVTKSSPQADDEEDEEEVDVEPQVTTRAIQAAGAEVGAEQTNSSASPTEEEVELPGVAPLLEDTADQPQTLDTAAGQQLNSTDDADAARLDVPSGGVDSTEEDGTSLPAEDLSHITPEEHNASVVAVYAGNEDDKETLAEGGPGTADTTEPLSVPLLTSVIAEDLEADKTGGEGTGVTTPDPLAHDDLPPENDSNDENDNTLPVPVIDDDSDELSTPAPETKDEINDDDDDEATPLPEEDDDDMTSKEKDENDDDDDTTLPAEDVNDVTTPAVEKPEEGNTIANVGEEEEERVGVAVHWASSTQRIPTLEEVEAAQVPEEEDLLDLGSGGSGDTPLVPVTHPKQEEDTPLVPVTQPKQEEDTPLVPVTQPKQEEDTTPLVPVTQPKQQDTPLVPVTQPKQQDTPLVPVTQPKQEDTPLVPVTQPKPEDTPLVPDRQPAHEEGQANNTSIVQEETGITGEGLSDSNNTKEAGPETKEEVIDSGTGQEGQLNLTEGGGAADKAGVDVVISKGEEPEDQVTEGAEQDSEEGGMHNASQEEGGVNVVWTVPEEEASKETPGHPGESTRRGHGKPVILGEEKEEEEKEEPGDVIEGHHLEASKHGKESNDDAESKRRTAIIVGVAIGGVALFAIGFFASRQCRKRGDFKVMKPVSREDNGLTNGNAESIEFRPVHANTGIYQDLDPAPHSGSHGNYKKIDKRSYAPLNTAPPPLSTFNSPHDDTYAIVNKKERPSAQQNSPDNHVNGLDKIRYIDETTDDEGGEGSRHLRLLTTKRTQHATLPEAHEEDDAPKVPPPQTPQPAAHDTHRSPDDTKNTPADSEGPPDSPSLNTSCESSEPATCLSTDVMLNLESMMNGSAVDGSEGSQGGSSDDLPPKLPDKKGDKALSLDNGQAATS